MDVIPYGRHQLDERDIAAVVDVLRGGMLTCGPVVAQFEAALALRCGTRHAVACSSATAALHLALLAARVGPGDVVVAPANTFLATANCAVYVGAEPRFCDVDYTSGLATAETIAPLLDDRVRAVLPVHFAGLPCDMPAINALVRQRCPQAVIVEDACHALGGQHADGAPVGACRWADMAVFSFHPVKHIAAGEGGMVLTDSDSLAERLRLLRAHGMTKVPGRLESPKEGPWYYEMHEVGCNYRIADINCALALSQLQRLDANVARRRSIAARYCEAFASCPNVALPVRNTPDNSAWHLFCLHVDFAALRMPRRQVVAELAERGVGTQVHYFPVPMQPYYRRRLGCGVGDFPAAERHYADALTIPLFAAMTDAEVEQVVSAVRDVLRLRSGIRETSAAPASRAA
jgi:UDP-4-amino-4,6-dideoxy-N-acetyl-beta-L-altrosamine transaminase